ncbi:MAG TPA: hydrolase [Cytophagales bacterium]|nr:hydrolase [Cytophagales bacterium]
MKLSKLWYLLLVTGTLAIHACDSTPEAPRMSWTELDSLYYSAPGYDSLHPEQLAFALQKLAKERLDTYEAAALHPSDSSLSRVDSLYTLTEFYDGLAKVAMAASEYQKAQVQIEKYSNLYRNTVLISWGGANIHPYDRYAAAYEDSLQRQVPLSEAYQAQLELLAEEIPFTERHTLFYYLENSASIIQPHQNWQAQLTQLDTVDSLSGAQLDDLLAAYVTKQVYGSEEEFMVELVNQYRADHYEILDSLRIPVGDGLMLDAQVVIPKGVEGPVPTILEANPYVYDMDVPIFSYWGADRGFASITVFPRGVRLSDGEFAPFEKEAEDLPKAIDWISKQPWSDGQVAMYGGSYLGFSQWAAMKNPHPALKTIVPQVSVGIGIDYPYHNRVPMNYALRWINYVTNANLSDYDDFGNTPYWDSLYMTWYTSGASSRGLDTLDQAPDAIYQRWLDHPDYDSYWQDMVASTPEDFAAIDIPILTTTGFFDDDQMGALHYYGLHQRYGKPEVVDQHHLIIGPYDHGGGQSLQWNGEVGGIEIDQNAFINLITMVYDWCDYVMLDGPKPELLQDRVNHYVMQQGWQHLPSVAAITDSLTLYPEGFGKEEPGALTTTPANGFTMLKEDFAPDSLDKLTFDYLLHKPELLPYFLEEGLVWETAPLTEEVVLAGRPAFQLTFTPNVKDVDLKVYLMEVSPEGEMMKLSECLQRISYVQNREQRQLLEPGEAITVHLKNSFWISRKVKPGARLRVIVTVNSDPEWQKNYGSGKLVADETSADFVPIELIFDLERTQIRLPLAPTLE